MRKVHRDMDAGPGGHMIGCRTILELRSVNRGVVVNRPKTFDLRFWKNVAIFAIKDMQHLGSADLEQKIAFAIHVVRRHTVWRGHKYDDIFLPCLHLSVVPGEFSDFPETIFK